MNAAALTDKMKVDLVKCKAHKNIMSDVITILEAESIDYKINGKRTEIKVVVPKTEIIKILRENISIPYMVFRLLFNVLEFKDKTYIRLKRR